MDQSELLKLARASLKKKGRSSRGTAAKALVQEEPPPPAAAEDGKTDQVERAISRIAQLDQKLAKLSALEAASESVAQAESLVLTMEPVDQADAKFQAMDAHIAREHEFARFDEAPPTRVAPAGPRLGGGLRAAFRLHLLLGPPKAMGS